MSLVQNRFDGKGRLVVMGGYGMYGEAIAMMADDRFHGELLITGRIRLDDILEKGFRPLVEEKDRHVKILVSPSS